MRWAAAIGAAMLAIACGGNNSPTASSSTPTATCGSGTTIVIYNNAVCPQNITVPLGTQVTFINNDTRVHDMESDPHPEHTDCPEIGQAGYLSPGQQRQTGNLVVARTCGYHDHQNFDVKSLQGSITIR